MKILVLGGTGRTGRHIITEALDRGHAVHAIVRNEQKVPADAQLKIFKGNPDDVILLEEALKDCDAVVSALNISRTSDFPWAPLRTPPDLIRRVIENVIRLSEKHDLKRIIVTSAWGVGDSKKEVPFFLNWLFYHTNLKYAYQEHENQERLLQHSAMIWTSVRPVGLTNGNKKAKVKVSFNGKPFPGMTISRKTVAKFVIDILEQEKYLHSTPTISG